MQAYEERYAPSGHHKHDVDTVEADISAPRLCDYIHAGETQPNFQFVKQSVLQVCVDACENFVGHRDVSTHNTETVVTV